MVRRAVLVLVGLLLVMPMQAQAQPEGVQVKLGEITYLNDPEVGWIWGARVIAEVANSSTKPVSGLVVHCSMQDSRGKEVLSAQQAVGTVPPNSVQRVNLEIRRTDSPPSQGIPGMSSQRSNSSQDKGLAAFKALKPVLTVK